MEDLDFRIFGTLFGIVGILVTALIAMFIHFMKETKKMHTQALEKFDVLIACNHKIKIDVATNKKDIEYNRERIEIAHDRIATKCSG